MDTRHPTNRIKSKSTICLNTGTGGIANKSHAKSNCSVHFESYDSPDAIIANLFPDIDYKETKYLRKGYGAVEMARRKKQGLLSPTTYRSASALANYGIENGRTRTHSTSSESSNQPRSYNKRQSLGTGRLASVERDFDYLRWFWIE